MSRSGWVGSATSTRGEPAGTRVRMNRFASSTRHPVSWPGDTGPTGSIPIIRTCSIPTPGIATSTVVESITLIATGKGKSVSAVDFRGVSRPAISRLDSTTIAVKMSDRVGRGGRFLANTTQPAFHHFTSVMAIRNGTKFGSTGSRLVIEAGRNPFGPCRSGGVTQPFSIGLHG